MGLLNGQTTKQESRALVERVVGGVVYKAEVQDTGPHRQVYLGHVPKDFSSINPFCSPWKLKVTTISPTWT
jgi:hypothetical protein